MGGRTGGWRSAAALGALALAAVGVVACGTPTAGSATANPSAAIPSPTRSTTASSAPAAVTTLTVTAVTTASAPPATDLAGEQYGFVTAVDVAAGTLSLDRIAYFTGAEAQKACAEDGVTDTSNNWCTGYYWRNNNPALRTLAVSPDATITVLDGSASVPGSLAQVATRITQATSTYRLVVTDGRVTELHEMYAP